MTRRFLETSQYNASDPSELTALIQENENQSLIPVLSTQSVPQINPQWSEQVTNLVQSFVAAHPRRMIQVALQQQQQQQDTSIGSISFWDGEGGKTHVNVTGLFSKSGFDSFMKKGLELYSRKIENSTEIQVTMSSFSAYLGKVWMLSTANATIEQLYATPSPDWVREQAKRGAIQQILPAVSKILSETERWIQDHRKELQINFEHRDKIYVDLLKSATAIKEIEKALGRFEEKDSLQNIVNQMKNIVKSVQDIDNDSLSRLYNETKHQIKERCGDLGKVLSEK